ncbi:MAG TPA: class I SAM-dependent methyltransferase [Allosphingosinicella sp.]|jgi:SAM-dependent methyltransferase|nr:class I SAM-dependent methyltransferase [Allosphingosinicella sp.]
MTTNSSGEKPGPAGSWPADGVAALGRCPVCGETRRSLFLDRLRDTTFYSAPGEWTLWRCADCRSLYLDPQPTPETIGLAYQDYYTHAAIPSADPPAEERRGLRAALVGRLSRSEPGYSERVPLPAGANRPKLLDVGCGNGEYLGRARKAGWEVFGCDFDPAAVVAARQSGAEVRQGGAESFLDSRGSFDAVTLSHVVEHVHDPAGLLALCLDLLKPGGSIFVDTPNADARGLALFGRSWRGLEPPRHLILFNWSGLERVMTRCGFDRLERLPQPGLALSLWVASDRIRSGYRPDAPRRASRRLLAMLPLLALIPRRRTEFITLRARKPGE